MGVVWSPKEGMLNRSPGTWDGGGHLLIVVIYISSYQSTIALIFHYIISQSVIFINLDTIDPLVLFISLLYHKFVGTITVHLSQPIQLKCRKRLKSHLSKVYANANSMGRVSCKY